MAPSIPRASSKEDLAGEELLLELDALNQALNQSRSHTRSKSLTSYALSPLHASELKCSRKRLLQPRPSFKVPFRSTSISCDRPRRLLSSSSTKQSKQHHQHTKKDATAHSHTEKEEDFQLPIEKLLEHSNHHENSHQHHKSRGHQHKGKGGPHQKEKGQEHSEKDSRYEQIYQRKSIWRWRPLRALSHIILGSRCHLNVLFSLQVRCIESLPVPMNGLSLTVLWIFKSHCLRTTPSKIVNGIAEFGETLQHQSTIHSTHCPNNIRRYDAKWCTLAIMAPSLDKLELARNYVDLSSFLPQDAADGNLWRDKCYDASYELSGMAKGGTLIVTFCHNLVQKHSSKASHGMQSTNKKTALLTKSLPLSSDVTPSVESKTSSSSCFSEHGAAIHLHHSMGHLTDTLQDSFTRDLHIAAGFSSHDYSDSFEFKPPLKDNHLVEFSFSHTHFITTDNYSKKYMTTLYDEGLPPFSHTIHAYEDFVVKGEGNKGTHKQPEQLKSQKPCECSQNRPPASGGLSFEEGRCERHPKMDFEDDLDSVAEEFLSMLGMGFDAGHHNSEADSESPRERLLQQFENDSLFMEISQ